MTHDPIQAARAYATEAERKVWEVEGVDLSIPPADLSQVCIIGGGQMGSGIATALLDAGIAVTLVETLPANRAQVGDRVRANWANRVRRRQMSQAEVDERMTRFTTLGDLADVPPAGLFIEAAWESLALKKEIFGRLSDVAAHDTILATNTSTLDVNAIAASTRRPENVVGLHFFSPAYVMRLLEVVRAARTSDRAIATALALARTLRKVPVVVGVCYGFVGNRMFGTRDAQANQLLLEGATPRQIDMALEAFGFAMGTFTLWDMAGGIELGWRLRQETGDSDAIGDALYHAGRLGQRAGKGYYRYDAGSRTPLPDPAVDAIIADVRRSGGITPRAIKDAEIVDRMILPMVNEAARILDEGIAQRASDIDAIWNTGYGWPIDRGGPAYYGDALGLPAVLQRLQTLQSAHGPHFAPAQLLERLARENRRLSDVSAARGAE